MQRLGRLKDSRARFEFPLSSGALAGRDGPNGDEREKGYDLPLTILY